MRFFAFVLAMTVTGRALACDICASTFELIPNERKSSFGIYYSTVYRQGFPALQTKHSGHLNYLGSEVKEIYDTYDFRMRYALNSRVFGEILVPIRNAYQGLNGYRNFDRWGLGDVQLQLTYRLVTPKVDNLFNQRLDLTFGLDLPTGSWTDSLNSIQLDPIYQFGSGSFDFWGSFSHVARVGQWGFSINGLYRRNTTNPLHFKFGDAVNLEGFLFFEMAQGSWKFLPRTGIFAEQGFSAKYRNLQDLHSGERMLSWQNGVSIFYKKIQLNATFRHVIYHQTRGVEVRQKYFGQFALIYNF